MAESLSEDQLNAIREKCADKRTDNRYTVLLQEEINTLLSAYESANAAPPTSQSKRKHEIEVRLYDFAKPDRFSKDYLNALQIIHEGFASELSTELSALCAAPTRVELIGVDQATYKQYRAAMPAKTLLAEVSIGATISDVFVGVNSSIVGVWVDYLCGGSPGAPSAPSGLTLVDIAVARSVVEVAARVYANSWPSLAQARPEIRRVTDSGTCDETAIAASEAMLLCSFEIQIESAVGTMTICIPASVVEQMMPVVTAAQPAQLSEKKIDRLSGEAVKAFSSVGLPCHVVLGKATISLSDLTNLEVGDVLRTNRRAGAETELWIGDRHLFNCRPGRQGANVAVVISGLEEQDKTDISLPAQQTTAASAAPTAADES